MKGKFIKALCAFLFFFVISTISIPECASRTASQISDREIIEALANIRGDIKSMQVEMQSRFRAMEERFDAVDQRFEAINQRFELVEKGFDRIDAQFDRFIHIIAIIVAAFVSIVAITIGFAVWDRRTMVRPFEDKVKVLEEKIGKDKNKLHNLIEALKTLSKTDIELAKVLKTFNLL